MTTHPTSAALQRAAVALLDEHDEDDVTVEMVLASSGASKGSLYHHFRSFDALLDRAQATRFAATVDRTIALLGTVASRDDVIDMLVSLAEGTLSDDDALRQCLLATSVRRTSLQELLGPEQQRLTDAVAALVRDAQSRRWLRADVDAHDVALLLETCAAGRVVAQVADADAWEQRLGHLLRAALGLHAQTGASIPAARSGSSAAPAAAQGQQRVWSDPD